MLSVNFDSVKCKKGGSNHVKVENGMDDAEEKATTALVSIMIQQQQQKIK